MAGTYDGEREYKYDTDTSEKDPFHMSDDSDKDPDYDGRERAKKQKVSDYFGVHQHARSGSSQSSDQPTSSASAIMARSTNNFESQSEPELFDEAPPLFDGTFYDVIERGSNFSLTAQCKKCLPAKKCIKGRSNSTTNFLKHLKTKHPGEHQKYLDYKKSKSSSLAMQNNSLPLTPSRSRDKTKQLDLKSSCNSGPKVSQDDFDQRIIKFVISSMSALSIIDNDSFTQLFAGFKVKVMSRKTAVRRISELSKKTLEKIKITLHSVQHVCTTADIWSSKKRSFLGMTCHWIDPASLERKSAALACRRFTGVHSFDRIAELIDDVHRSFGLKTEKITATITDNGSNFVKAFKEFGIGISSSLIFNSIAPFQTESDEIETDEDIDSLDEFDDAFFVTNMNMPSSHDPGEEYLTSIIQLPKHHRCISHTINLVATTDLTKFINKSHTTRTRHTNTLNKCSQLWIKAGRPKSAEIIKEVLGHHLSYLGITRWNSHYDAITQILTVREKLPFLYEKLAIKQHCLKENEVEYLTEYIKLFKPLALALDILQGDTNIFHGFVIPTILSMRLKLEKLKTEQLKYLASAVDDIVTAVSKRFEPYLTLTNEEAVVAAFCHPSFKMRWVTPFKDDRELGQEGTSEKLKRLFIKAANEVAIGETVSECVENSRRNPLDDFFEFDDDDDSSPQTLSSGKGELQALQYLQDSQTSLEMLRKYPVVLKLFLKYNTTLPSSAPVERMFSFATFIDTPRRHALSDNNFENLVLMKANAAFF